MSSIERVHLVLALGLLNVALVAATILVGLGTWPEPPVGAPGPAPQGAAGSPSLAGGAARSATPRPTAPPGGPSASLPAAPSPPGPSALLPSPAPDEGTTALGPSPTPPASDTEPVTSPGRTPGPGSKPARSPRPAHTAVAPPAAPTSTPPGPLLTPEPASARLRLLPLVALSGRTLRRRHGSP